MHPPVTSREYCGLGNRGSAGRKSPDVKVIPRHPIYDLFFASRVILAGHDRSFVYGQDDIFSSQEKLPDFEAQVL
jgi:hypothetical protein